LVGFRIAEIFGGALACYVGYFIFFKEGWDYIHDQPVPKLSGLVFASFGFILIIVNIYRIIKLLTNKHKQ